MRRASVLLPFRDAESTLKEALDSVLDEDVDFELLAVDDGSSDRSLEIALDRSASDKRLRVIEGPARGLVAALNHGLEVARAPFIVRMDADDIHHAPRIARSIEALEADAGLGLVGTRVEVLADATPGEGLLRYVDWQSSLLEHEDHARELFVESPLCHPTFAFRASTIAALGGYRDGPFPEDYDLVLRMNGAGLRLQKLPFVGLSWRHRSGRLTFRDPRYSVDAFRALKVEHLRPIALSASRPLYVWGAGRDGRRFAKALIGAGVQVEAFLDIDEKKIGRSAQGRKILGFEALPEPSEAFVVVSVGTRGARELIRAELRKRGFRELIDFRCVA